MSEAWQKTFGTTANARLSSRTNRLLGQLLDALIIACLAFAGEFLVSRFAELEGWPQMLAVLPALAYYFLADALPGGRSLGKRVLDMRVVDAETSQPCSFGQSFIRNLLLAILGPIDWLFIFGDRRQRLGDKAAGTLVINTDF
jgi:uncharacterized RDD family membrane protein YckC